MTVLSVSFTGEALDGVSMMDWWDDSSNWNNAPDEGEPLDDTDVIAPEWERSTGKNKFALETIGVLWRARVVFDIPMAWQSAPVAWAASNVVGLELASESSPLPLEHLGGTLWAGTFRIAQGAEVIEHYDVQWSWNVRVDASTYQDVTTHVVGVGSLHPGEYSPGDPFVAYGDDPGGPPGGKPEPQPRKVYTWADLVTDWTKGKDPTKDQEAILTTITTRLGDAAYGLKYEFPNENARHSRPEPFSSQALLKYKTGSCSNWAYLLMHAAAVLKVQTTLRAAHTKSVQGQPFSNYAECFETPQVTPRNGNARTYVFGDHWFVEYNAKCWDPSFDVTYNKPWGDYMHDRVMARLAVPDPEKVQAWTRCDAIRSPQNVIWMVYGDGPKSVRLFDMANQNEPEKSWTLSLPPP